jgi:hypothetical protein
VVSRTVHLALALALALCACSDSAAPATEISLVLTSDLSIPDQLDELRVHVLGPDGSEQSATGLLRAAGDLPRRVVLRHTQGELAPLEVTAEGLLGGSPVITRRARFAFVLHERRMAELALLARCVDVSCSEGTCSEDGCVDVAFEPGAGADLDASAEVDAPDRSDAAATEPDAAEADDAGPLDAGLDGGASDGGRPLDGGARDAGRADASRLQTGDGGWLSPMAVSLRRPASTRAPMHPRAAGPRHGARHGPCAAIPWRGAGATGRVAQLFRERARGCRFCREKCVTRR